MPTLFAGKAADLGIGRESYYRRRILPKSSVYSCPLRVRLEEVVDSLIFPSSPSGIMVCSMNRRPVFEKNRYDKLIEGEEGELPYLENLTVIGNKKSQISSLNPPSLVFKERNIRLHYLDVRDEEALSKRILELSRTNQVRSAMELFRSMELTGLRPSLHASNSLLSCLIRNNMLDLALEVFEAMNITSGHSCSLVLKAVADSQGSKAALRLFRKLESESRVKKGFDAIVYNTMISICGKMNDWVQMEKIWTTMKEHEHVGTTITFRVLVCTSVRCGQYEFAIDAYYEMLRHGLRPSNDIMQAVICASTKEGKWGLALSVFQIMLKMGLKPNSVTLNALINSLGKAGKVKTAFEVYKHMKSLGHLPDTFTWNALLGALHRANQHVKALQLFDTISKDQSCELNVNLYNTALLCCQRLCLWDKAIQLLWQMEESRLPVTTASYNLVIGACEAARKPRFAMEVYKHMIHRNTVPDTFTRLSLIRCCIWGSMWSEVDEILGHLTPNVSLYNAAIHGMCLKGDNSLSCFRGLVLDISYRPINIVCWRRAICLEFMEKADVLEYYDQTVNSPSGAFYIPAVLRVPHLLQVVKRKRIRNTLSRKNIFYRDGYICQYCSATNNLTIDHVLPVARGGKWVWDNLVTACARCNSKKGQKTLEEANMSLLKAPKAPKEYEILAIPLTSSTVRMLRMRKETPLEWRQYLSKSSLDS